MAILINYRLPGLTVAEYEAVRAKVGWDARPPAGAIGHAIGFKDGEAIESDLWEDRASFDAYRRERLSPVLDALGVQVPEPEIVELHSIALGQDIAAFQLSAVPEARRVLESDALA